MIYVNSLNTVSGIINLCLESGSIDRLSNVVSRFVASNLNSNYISQASILPPVGSKYMHQLITMSDALCKNAINAFMKFNLLVASLKKPVRVSRGLRIFPETRSIYEPNEIEMDPETMIAKIQFPYGNIKLL